MMQPPAKGDGSLSSSNSFSSLEDGAAAAVSAARAPVGSMAPPAESSSSDSDDEDVVMASKTRPSGVASEGAVSGTSAVPVAAAAALTHGGTGQDSPPSRDFSPTGAADEDEIVVDIDDLCPPAAFGHATGAGAPARPPVARTTGLGGDSDSEASNDGGDPVAPVEAAVTTGAKPAPAGTAPRTGLVATPTGPLAAAIVRRASPVPTYQALPPPVTVPPVSAAAATEAPKSTLGAPPPPPTPAVSEASAPVANAASAERSLSLGEAKSAPAEENSSEMSRRPTAFPAVPNVAPAAKPAAAVQPKVVPTGPPAHQTPPRNTADMGKAPPPPPPPPAPPSTSAPAAAKEMGYGAAMDEFDQATQQFEAAQAAAGAAPAVRLMNITWDEAYREIRKQTASWRKYVTPAMKRVSDRVKTNGFWGACWSCWHHDIAEGEPLYDERDFVLALRQVEFDHRNEIHRRVLLTVWRLLVKPDRNTPDPSTTGPAWIALGFQGTDPATDLRANGIFGLLQLLFLVDYTRLLAGAMFEVASSRLLEFPLAIVSFNFTAVATQCLLDRLLHDTIVSRYQNAAKVGDASHERKMKLDGGTIDVAMVLNQVYVGCVYQFLEKWQEEPQRRITDFDGIRKTIAKHTTDKPSSAIAAYEAARTEYSREGIRAKREARLKAQLDPILDKGPSRFNDF